MTWKAYENYDELSKHCKMAKKLKNEFMQHKMVYISVMLYLAECGNFSANVPIVSRQQLSNGIKCIMYWVSSLAEDEKCSLTSLQVSSAPEMI